MRHIRLLVLEEILAQFGGVGFIIAVHQIGTALRACELSGSLQFLQIAADGFLTALQCFA